MLPDLMGLNLCNIQILASEFVLKNTKAWIHPALYQETLVNSEQMKPQL